MNWSLRAKLLGIIGLILTLLLIVGGLAIGMNRSMSRVADESTRRHKDAVDAHELMIEALHCYQLQADTIINRKTDGQEFTDANAALDKAIQLFASAADTAEEKSWCSAMENASKKISENYHQTILPLTRKSVETKDFAEFTKQQEQLSKADTMTDAYLVEFMTYAEKCVTSLERESQVAESEFTTLAATTRQLITAIGIAALAFGGFLGTRLALGLTKSIQGVASALAAGAEQTTAAARQVSTSSQSLSEASSEQAATLEETSSSLEELASMTKRNADNAEQVKDLSTQACAAGDIGAADVQTMNQAMNDMKSSSDGIAKIIKTIDEIAFQTNILALNAAVEAARAGEAGAGFAVVADEVRNLAQRAAQAARETAGKIEDSVSKSQNGVQISAKVAESLANIIGKARQVNELANQVATASKEQTEGINQINTAISQMDKVTQSNAANAEETASAAEELNAQAECALEAVSELVRIVNGAASTATQSVQSTKRAYTPPVRNNRSSSHHAQAFVSASANGHRNGNGIKSRPQRAMAHADAANESNGNVEL
ncbi:MAG: methyl-accepting chemotaxis protein [Verrucomicrobiota bacterium]|nr:methyl-accepting chemotaxis protein [Verrucomicrobiota bacterium]